MWDFRNLGDVIVALTTLLTTLSTVIGLVAARVSAKVRQRDDQIDAYATNVGRLRRALLELGEPLPSLVPIPQKGAKDGLRIADTGGADDDRDAAPRPAPVAVGSAVEPRHRRAGT